MLELYEEKNLIHFLGKKQWTNEKVFFFLQKKKKKKIQLQISLQMYL